MTLSNAAIERIGLSLLDRTLPRPEWTHMAHFAAALWLLRHRPALTGPTEMRDVISRYNAASGAPNTDVSGYHHSITRASMRAAREMLDRHPGAPLGEVLARLMASPLGHPDWLLPYWRRETLFGAPARTGWIEPDLSPLPFA